jgi:hypothetical protein
MEILGFKKICINSFKKKEFDIKKTHYYNNLILKILIKLHILLINH